MMGESQMGSDRRLLDAILIPTVVGTIINFGIPHKLTCSHVFMVALFWCTLALHVLTLLFLYAPFSLHFSVLEESRL